MISFADAAAHVDRDCARRGEDLARRNGAGEQLWFVHNFGFDLVAAAPPRPMMDLLTGDPVHTVELGPWDVRILMEAP